MNNLKTVIFDMDGLLFDTERLYYRANQAAADEMELPFNWEYFERFVGSSEHALYNSVTKDFSSKSKARLFIERSEEIALSLMLEEEVGKKPGVEQLLSFLKEKNIQMTIGSNSQRKVIKLLLDRTNLTHYFPTYVGVDEVENGKPSSEIYLKALEKTRTSSDQALVLEDSINGVKAAHAAGISVIMVPDLEQANDEAEEKALHVFKDLQDVQFFLQKEWIK